MTVREVTWQLQENAIDHDSIEELVQFIRTTGRYTQSTKVKEFEEAWSKWLGCRYSVFVNSGSSANLMILDVLKDLNKWAIGDEIVVPAVTWVTDISSVLQLGLQPIFVDINLDDLSFDYDMLASKITRNTRAIFITHLIGFPANIERIKRIVGGRDIAIIEDCCEAHGAQIDNVKLGNFGACSSFSFYWGHHMTTIEGGIMSTSNRDIYEYALLKRSHGLARELPTGSHSSYRDRYSDVDFDFLFLTTGFNLRNTELNAVLGISQLTKVDKCIAIRIENYKRFLNILRNYSEEFCLPDRRGSSPFCLPIITRRAELRRDLQCFIAAKGIECRPIVSGNLLRQPFLKQFARSHDFPNAEFIHANGFYIGNNQFVDENRLSSFADVLTEYFAKRRV